MTEQNTGSPYMIFILVFCFFIMGLLGFVICHMLKDKGYRCRTTESEDEDCKNDVAPDSDDESEGNQDTVEKILQCIIKNEANMEAFSEMLGNQNSFEHRDQRLLWKESLEGLPSHHHTIHLGGDQNFCHHCGQGHCKRNQQRNHMVRSKGRLGEQTVLSVGRFRVTHMEKKAGLQDSSHFPIADSRDQSEPLNCETRDNLKTNQESYNIRNMFKDIEANAIVSNASKSKKSVTLLGFRRVSDVVSTLENQGKAEKNTQHDISVRFPARSEETSGPYQVLETGTQIILDNKSHTGFLKTADVVEKTPDNKQTDKISIKSELNEV